MKRLGLISLLLILAQTSFCATEYFVRIGGNNAKDGKSWANAKAGIQASVDATTAGDTVTVSKWYLQDDRTRTVVSPRTDKSDYRALRQRPRSDHY